MDEQPPLRFSDEQWRAHLFNHERFLKTQDQIVDILNDLLRQEGEITRASDALIEHLARLANVMKESSEASKVMISGLIQVPITLAVIGLASWGFYTDKIKEWTWIVLLAVASFRYLGDSIQGVAKLIRGKTNGHS